MTVNEKMALQEFDTQHRRLYTLYLLTQAAYQGKDLSKITVVFDRWGGVSLLETK